MTDDSIVTAQITITRHYHPDAERPEDADTVSVDVEGLTLVETLGLLEFAKADVIADLVRDDPED